MIKQLFSFFGALFIILAPGCTSEKPQNEKPLVYEGMSAQELRNNLGEPTSIDSSGQIYDTRYKKKMIVERWRYDKRTVLIINDTVKDSNLN